MKNPDMGGCGGMIGNPLGCPAAEMIKNLGERQGPLLGVHVALGAWGICPHGGE